MHTQSTLRRTTSTHFLRFFPSWFAVALLLLTALGLQCGQTPSGGTTQALQLALSPSQPQIAQGTGQQFQLRGLREDGHILELSRKGKWTVQAPDGAVLPSPQAGLVELTTPGRYQVAVEYAGQTVRTELLVTTATLSTLSISPTLPKVAKGLTQQFKVTATFSDGTTQDVTALSAWSVRDSVGTGVATVNSLGLATAKAVGKARISAKFQTKTTSTTLEVTAAALKTLTLSPLEVSLAKGTQQRFSVVGSFSDGTEVDVTALADWAVLDVMGSGVASVDGTGTVHGDSEGKAKVSAEYLGVVAETNLTVTPAAPTSLTVTPASASLAKGTTQKYVATATFTDGTSQDVSAMSAWTSSDVTGAMVAMVDGSGLATGNAVGTASIRCAFKGYSATAQLVVRPAALVTVTLSPTSAKVAKGLTQQFVLTGTYTDASTQNLSGVAVWSATDVMGTDVVGLTGAGGAVARSVGQAQVKAEHMGLSATATMTVEPATLTALRLSPSTPSLAVGESVQLVVTGVYTDGSSRDVTSSSTFAVSDIAPATGVASVSATGLAKGLSRGLARVTVTAGTLRAEITLAVGVGVSLCSVDKWCWSNPLPQGNYVPSLWGSSASSVWGVSDHGAIFKWDGVSWTGQVSPTSANLQAVWGLDARNVWAVGVAGTILKWDGSAWTVQASGVTASLSAIWGSSARDVWVAGDQGTLLHWDGSAWTSVASGVTVYLRGLFGTDSSNVWAVGNLGTILKWNGVAWSPQTSGVTSYLRAIYGTDASNLWVVGSGGTILKWDGSAWTAQASGSVQSLRGIWGSSASNIWAVGGGGTVLKWNGTDWRAQSVGTTDNLITVWGSSPSSLWVGGDQGLILSYNGTSWTLPPAWSRSNLSATWASDAHNIWMAGAGGTILKWNGATVTPQLSGTGNNLTGLWGLDSSNVWAVGAAGTILKWDGSSWTSQPSGTTETLYAVWGADSKNVWAVGYSGVIVKWDGTSWSPQVSGVTSSLYGVWGTSASSVFVVGAAGQILLWNGSSWLRYSSDGLTTLTGVWGTDLSNVWAVGSGGAIKRWNGFVLTNVPSGTAHTLTSIWGSDANNMYAVGSVGTILRWNGTAWSPQQSPRPLTLTSVFGTSASQVFAVGPTGTFLQHLTP